MMERKNHISHNKKLGRTKKIGKRTAVLIAFITVCAAIGTAVAYSYYMKTESTHSLGRLWEIKDNSSGTMGDYAEMGDTLITYDTDNASSEEFTFWIKLGGRSNADKNLYFYITEDLANGVNLTVEYNNSGVWEEIQDSGTVLFSPEDEKEFRYIVDIDEYTPSGEYTTSLLIEKN